MLVSPSPTEHASGLASAPGDLPTPALLQREQLKATQFRHDNQLSTTAPLPEEGVTITATSGAALNLVRAEVWYTLDGRWPDASAHSLPMRRSDTTWSLATSYLDVWEATLPPQPDGTIVRYAIAGYTAEADGVPSHFALDGSGFWFQLGEEGLTTFAYRVQATPRNLPTWMEEAVIYHIFLDRFRPSEPNGRFPPGQDPNAKHGGTLRGVRAALPYLEELGVNCLWLSPLGPSPTYHRYDQRDFFAIDPDLGTLDELRDLIATLHARGMRIILDFVPSHASWEMPEFKAAQANHHAPSAAWFVFEEWPDKYRCFLGIVPFLVSLNGQDEGARQFLIDSARFWVADVGFDGLRLDHSIGQGSDFWVAFRSALEAAKPDLAIFGEATDTPDHLRRNHGRLHGVLDFPLAQILRLGIGQGALSAAEISGALSAINRYFEAGPGRVTFFDNHDMNRFLFVAGGDKRRLKLAALCLFTLPFTPVLYYGTEIGLSQNVDKDAGGFGGDHVVRTDMAWHPAAWDTELLAFFKAIITLRRTQPVMQRGSWQSLPQGADSPLLVYKLHLGTVQQTVILNLSAEWQNHDFTGEAEKSLLLATASQVKLQKQRLNLPPLSGAIVGQ